jgi:ribonuclease PH
MNVVMLQRIAAADGLALPDGEARFVEVQGTAEGMAFSRAELDDLLGLASVGLAEIIGLQAEMISDPPPPRPIGR